MKKEWNNAVITELDVRFTEQNPTQQPLTWDGFIYDENGKAYALKEGETPSGNSIQIPAELQ